MKTVTLAEFRKEAVDQAPSSDLVVYKCPMCETLQTARDLVSAGAGESLDEVERYLGFSCIGRFTGRGSPSAEKGKGHGCNWTLGGLFQMHSFEVVTPDGKAHPLFELADKDAAAAHRSKGAQP